MPGIKKKLLKVVAILIIGGLGGVFADRVFLPYLANLSFFSKIEFIKKAGSGTTIINKTEEIFITENIAIEQAIDKIIPSLVVIQAYKDKKLITQGSGFIATSDGLVVTAADLLAVRADQYLILQKERFLIGQIIKKDSVNNLALLKVEETNLPVVAFADLEALGLGQRIILIGAQISNNNFYYFVNIGTIRGIESGIMAINLNEDSQLANGGPLVNTKGEVIGLNLVDEQGLVKAVPAEQIKWFIGL